MKRSSLKINNSLEGETIECKMERIIRNREPIKDGAPLIYTERKDGVMAGYNIKTDRFDVAIEGMSTVEKSIQAKRENKAQMSIVKEDTAEPKSTDGTNNE